MSNKGNQQPAGHIKDTKHQPAKNNPDKEKGARKAFKKEDMPDPDEEPIMESDFDPDRPEKKIQIDDNPEETKRKIPHMNK
jgi:hypothetical protein